MTNTDLVLTFEPDMTDEEARTKLEEIVPELETTKGWWGYFSELMREFIRRAVEEFDQTYFSCMLALAFIGFFLGWLFTGPSRWTSLGVVGFLLLPTLFAVDTLVWFIKRRPNEARPPSLETVQQKVIDHYTAHFDTWKEEHIGEHSPLAKRRQAFSDAAQGAEEGLAYWRNIEKRNPNDTEAQEKIEELIALHKHFERAEKVVAARMKAVGSAVAEVKGHLDSLSGRMTRERERVRVRRLKEQAEIMVVQTEDELNTMIASFVREIREISTIGAEIERRHIAQLAVTTDTSTLFEEAKRISGQSANDTRALAELARTLRGETPDQLGKASELSVEPV